MLKRCPECKEMFLLQDVPRLGKPVICENCAPKKKEEKK